MTQHDNIVAVMAEVKRIAIHRGGDWVDHNGHASHKARRVARMSLMCARTETGVRNYGNYNVRGSAQLPHDAMGSDHDSVGPMQQRVGYDGTGSGGWGSMAHCQSMRGGTQSFVKRLIEKGLDNTGKGALKMGRACQAVQVSAYPTRYAFNYLWAGRQIGKHWDHVAPAKNPTP